VPAVGRVGAATHVARARRALTATGPASR
jgi:hypothetical protein